MVADVVFAVVGIVAAVAAVVIVTMVTTVGQCSASISVTTLVVRCDHLGGLFRQNQK